MANDETRMRTIRLAGTGIDRLWRQIRPRALVLLAGALLQGTSFAAVFNEYQVKAAFLFHFAQFVSWPGAAFPADASPIVIGLLGEDPFGGVLGEIFKGEVVRGRRLVVKQLSSPESARDCHILFVSASEVSRLPRILGAIRGRSVLTVSETEGFCPSGGIVNFVTQRDRIGIEINPEAAEKAGLRINSRLLKLAKLVPGEN